MGVIVWAHQQWDNYPMVLVSLRETNIGTPTDPPSLLRKDPCVWAGIDGLSGGTWLGVNEQSVVVGMVKLHTEEHDADLRARALPSLDALAQEDAYDAASSIASTLEVWPSNPALYLCLDPDQCWIVETHPKIMRRQLSPGVHGISSEGGCNPTDDDRAQRAIQAMQRMTENTQPTMSLLHSFCRQYALAQVRTGYSTCSASVIFWHKSADLRLCRYEFANGHPASAPFGEVLRNIVVKTEEEKYKHESTE